MNSPQMIAEIIINEVSKKGTSVNKMLIECNVNKSVVDNLKRGRVASSDIIAKIANYLEVSTDYLLGNDTEYPSIKDEDLKFALYGTTEITDEVFDAVKTFVEVQKQKLKEQGLL